MREVGGVSPFWSPLRPGAMSSGRSDQLRCRAVEGAVRHGVVVIQKERRKGMQVKTKDL